MILTQTRYCFNFSYRDDNEHSWLGFINFHIILITRQVKNLKIINSSYRYLHGYSLSTYYLLFNKNIIYISYYIKKNQNIL